MSEAKLNIATLGTRESVIQVTAAVTVTAGAGATNQLAVTFEKAFVNAPKIIAVDSQEVGLLKANLRVTNVSNTGLTVNVYQVLAGDVVNGTYNVNVTLVGWKAS